MQTFSRTHSVRTLQSLRGVFSDVHAAGKHGFDLISPPAGGKTLPRAFTLAENRFFFASAFLEAAPPPGAQNQKLTAAAESSPRCGYAPR